MKLPGDLGYIEFGDWAYGLTSAFISGGATAIAGGTAVGMVDSNHFNIHTPALWTVMGIMFLINGISNGANFLRTRPLPVFKTTEKTVETTQQKGQPPIVVITQKETQVEPLKPEVK